MLIDRLLKVALAGSTWVLYLLLALSVLSLAAMLERWLYFRRHRDDGSRLRSNVSQALLQGETQRARDFLTKSPGLSAQVVTSALDWEHGGAAAVSDALDSELGALRKDLERGTNLLGTLGNNAPFVGLFGTVLGVIEAFHQLAGGPGKAAMGNVMSGIAEALVATGVGLFVALPAVVAYNIVQKRIGEIESEAIALGKLFSAELRSRGSASRTENSGTTLADAVE